MGRIIGTAVMPTVPINIIKESKIIGIHAYVLGILSRYNVYAANASNPKPVPKADNRNRRCIHDETVQKKSPVNVFPQVLLKQTLFPKFLMTAHVVTLANN